MTVLRIQLAVDKLRVIFLDVTASCVLEELVTVVHFHAQRIQCLYHLRHVGDDGILSVGQLGQEMAFNRRIDGKFHLLRVDDDGIPVETYGDTLGDTLGSHSCLSILITWVKGEAHDTEMLVADTFQGINEVTLSNIFFTVFILILLS